MSSKSPNEKPNTSKSMPALDVMVTRHQSAQQKRQLRKMDRSMKNITSLLKSPERASPKKSATIKTTNSKKPTVSPPSTVYKNPAPKTYGAATTNKTNSVSPKTYSAATTNKTNSVSPKTYGAATTNKTNSVSPKSYGAATTNKTNSVSPKTYGAANTNRVNSVMPKTYRCTVSPTVTSTKEADYKPVLLQNTSGNTKSLTLPSTSMETSKSLLIPETCMATNITRTNSVPNNVSLKSVPVNTSTMPVTVPVARGRRIKISPRMAVKLLKQNEPIKVERKAVKKKTVTGKYIEHTQGEYYPNTKKREGISKKFKLQPKYALKCIGKPGSRKRKLSIPRKGGNQPSQATNTATKGPRPARSLSPEDEMLLMMEEMDQNLTDEDMMELLTCPSPVWWEDPPDPSYTEEPIYTQRGKKIFFNSRVPRENRKRRRTAIYELNDEPAAKTNRTDDVSVLREISTSGRDENFNKKRNTLEGVLSTIKSKKIPKETANSYKDKTVWEKSKVLNATTGKVREDITAGNSDDVIIISCQHSRNIKSGIPKKLEPNAEAENRRKSSDDVSIVSIASSKCSVSSFTCPDKAEDDILNDLENLQIPIKHHENNDQTSTRRESTECIILDDEDDKTNEISILDNPVSTVEKNLQMSILEGSGEVKIPEFKLRYLEKADSPKTLIWTSNDGDKKIINLVNDAESVTTDEATETEPYVVPRNLPPLRKYQKVAKVTKRFSTEKCSVIIGDKSNTIQVKVGMTDDQISDFVSAVKQTNRIRNIEKTNLSDALLHPDLATKSTQVDLTTDEVVDMLNVGSPIDDIEMVKDVKKAGISSRTVKAQIKSVYKKFFQTDRSIITRNKESDVKENRLQHLEIEETNSQNIKQHRLNVYKIIDKTDDEKSDKTDDVEIVEEDKEPGTNSGTLKSNKQQTISKLKSVYKQFFDKQADKKETTPNIESEVKEKQHRLNVYKIIDKTDDEKSDKIESETEQLSQITSKDAKRLAMLTKTDETLTKLVRKPPFVIKVKKNMLEQVMQTYAT